MRIARTRVVQMASMRGPRLRSQASGDRAIDTEVYFEICRQAIVFDNGET